MQRDAVGVATELAVDCSICPQHKNLRCALAPYFESMMSSLLGAVPVHLARCACPSGPTLPEPVELFAYGTRLLVKSGFLVNSVQRENKASVTGIEKSYR
jgi:hypothetical protein